MKKLYILFALILCSLFLVACNNSETGEKKELQAKEKKETFKKLSKNEAKELIGSSLEEIVDTISAYNYAEFPENRDKWFDDYTNNSEPNDRASKDLSKLIGDLATDKGIEEMVLPHLASYVRDGYFAGAARESDLNKRFTIEEQSKDRLNVSSIRLVDEAGFNPSSTIELSYLKEDDKWKLNGFKEVSTEDRSLNLTKEDVEGDCGSEENQEVSIENIKRDKESYLVIRCGDNGLGVRNIVDGEYNYDLMSEYRVEEEGIQEE